LIELKESAVVCHPGSADGPSAIVAEGTGATLPLWDGRERPRSQRNGPQRKHGALCATKDDQRNQLPISRREFFRALQMVCGSLSGSKRRPILGNPSLALFESGRGAYDLAQATHFSSAQIGHPSIYERGCSQVGLFDPKPTLGNLQDCAWDIISELVLAKVAVSSLAIQILQAGKVGNQFLGSSPHLLNVLTYLQFDQCGDISITSPPCTSYTAAEHYLAGRLWFLVLTASAAKSKSSAYVVLDDRVPHQQHSKLAIRLAARLPEYRFHSRLRC
jgi:hypothetical protein